MHASMRQGLVAALMSLALGGGGTAFGDDTAPDDLTQMSLADLAKVDVTSVSKTSEPLQRAPAAIYVISHEDIERSGVTSIPEALRLAPNLLVTQTSSSAYVISARGFGGNPNAQNFSNKLLILIDGRSVYTPLFSGIYVNTLDVMLEDVDRIEVISGVGATLWGANAMNGVINIITRAAYLTQGSTHYYNLDLRLGWQASHALALSIRGANLLGPQHTEFPAPNGDQIVRGVFAEARLKF